MTIEAPPTAAGASGATYEDRIKELEKENKGLKSDIAEKRETIRSLKSLEEKFQALEQSLASAGEEEPPVPNGANVQEKVAQLAQDPDGYIRKQLQDSEVVKRLEVLETRLQKEEDDRKLKSAYEEIARKEGKSVKEIMNSEMDVELLRITKERGLGAMDYFSGPLAAYDIWKQEQLEKKKREAEREAAIEEQSTETVKPPRKSSAPGSFTRADIAKMSLKEFEQNRDAIEKAAREGRIT